MPQNYMTSYLPILIQLVLAIGLSTVIITLSTLIGRHRRTKRKLAPYECGVAPEGDASSRFAVKFYLVAIIFILFDIEAVFLIPWAVVFRSLKLAGFFEMVVYIVVVLAGFSYIWKKGVLDWNTPERAE